MSNFQTFVCCAHTFVVPAGVSTIQVEAVGAGGAGDGFYGGGGSGAYERAVLSVVPGSSYSITVEYGLDAYSKLTLVQDQSGTTVVCGAGGQDSPGIGGNFINCPNFASLQGFLNINGQYGQSVSAGGSGFVLVSW